MKRRTKKRSLATPDLTPLIDVVFLLLIFFMLVTTFDKYSGFKLELPKSGAISESSNLEYELIIDKDEKYYISVDKISTEIMLENLSEKLKNVKEITISADKDLRYEVVVKAIAKLKDIGIDKVELNFNE
ncbi:MAG: ExbD/TolR family protein [Cetobacterium sp.]|uniref:ExbD/TolR family protein n=1 Tax=unclassified Cetobacterium TaxID=2630983 RepID=UPI0006462077|nr:MULTISPECIES: biopolymer transporter ExbD [unclassified Cetobacterium]